MNTTMKNVFMLILGAALILSMAGAVSAAMEGAGTEQNSDDVGFTGDIAERPAGETEVKITIDGQYTLTIPSSVDLSTAGERYSYVSISNVALGKNKELTVKATSTYAQSGVLNLNGNSQTVPYYLNISDGIKSLYVPESTEDTEYTSNYLTSTTVSEKTITIMTIKSSDSQDGSTVTYTGSTNGVTPATSFESGAGTVYIKFEPVAVDNLVAGQEYTDTLSFKVAVSTPDATT